MGTCTTKQVKSLKIDLNGFLQITAKEVESKNFTSFFSAQNFLLQRKYWRNENKMKKKSNTKKPEKTPKKAQKRLKNHQKPSKTIKNIQKTTKNRVKSTEIH